MLGALLWGIGASMALAEENEKAKIKSKDEQLTEAKKLLKQWLQTTQANGCDNINIVADTQNFLKE